MKEKLTYLKAAQFHPFDSFYEIRFRQKGSTLLAFLIMLIYGVVQCAAYQYTGFIMNKNALHEMNSISLFISSISVLLLFTVSNWTVTTVFDGKGKMKDIYIMICYSLVPLIVTNVIQIILSNYIIKEEILIVRMFQGIGIVWFAFLAISGLCVIHEYTLSKNILSLLATVVAAAVIIFVLVMLFTLEEKMFQFIVAVVRELMRRIRTGGL